MRNEKTVIYLILNLKTLLKDIKTLYKDILNDFHNDDEGYPDKVDNENDLKFYKVKNLKTSEGNEDLKFDLIEDDDQSLLELGLKDLDLLFVGTKYSIKGMCVYIYIRIRIN